MIITNITDKTTPKPIGIGAFVLMPGEQYDIPNEVVYVDEVDKKGVKTGRKTILPAVILLEGMKQITYVENKKEEAEEETVAVDEPVEETTVEEKKKRGRKKAE